MHYTILRARAASRHFWIHGSDFEMDGAAHTHVHLAWRRELCVYYIRILCRRVSVFFPEFPGLRRFSRIYSFGILFASRQRAFLKFIHSWDFCLFSPSSSSSGVVGELAQQFFFFSRQHNIARDVRGAHARLFSTIFFTCPRCFYVSSLRADAAWYFLFSLASCAFGLTFWNWEKFLLCAEQ